MYSILMKKTFKIGFIFLGLLLLFGLVKFFTLSDLRLEGYTFPNNEAKAKQLLKEMGVAHNSHLWDSIKTYSVIYEDEFYGFIGKQSHPFTEQKMKFALRYASNTTNGQLEILSGKEKGTIWGIQSGKTYEVINNTATSKANAEMEFWIPTYQYFIEFPSRIQEATAIDYIGEKTISGIKTEGVIASWDTIAPQRDIDQYVIWIDKDSKRIVKLEYTVRDAYGFVSGAASFNEYKSYNGFLLPSSMPVESNLVKDGLLHQMKISDFKVNSVSRESLRPLD